MGIVRLHNVRKTSCSLSWRFKTFRNHRKTRTTISNVSFSPFFPSFNSIETDQTNRFDYFHWISRFSIIILTNFSWKRMLRKYFVTYPLVFICFAISIWIYFYYYRIQKKTDENYPLNSSFMLIQAKYIRLLPSAVYSLAIIPLNSIYTKFATILTNFGQSAERVEREKMKRFFFRS